MTSSEEILLQIPFVKYKKGDGTLYLMSERLAWIMDNKDTVSLSHRYADIKLQKISPEGKPKIQLQVVLHDGTTSTFQFVNKQGQPDCIKDRDKVKDLLFNLLPKFKKKVNKELEEKNRLLSENPALLQLYKDLVITQVVTSEEFWTQHAPQYTNKNAMPKQQVGVSGAFLADIKPQTDGCNGLKYNLTAEVMEAVFRTYPAVRIKHKEVVPTKMTEQQFWTKFFQSHYFHRDRINTVGSKDIFTECAKIDDQMLSKEMSKGISDPLVNVNSFSDKTLDEGYGCLNEKQSSQNIVHQSMIKRFNQHSIMVMKACQSSSALGMPVEPSKEEEEAKKAKKRKIQEKIQYEDLEAGSEETVQPTKLSLTRVERYLQGPGGEAESGARGAGAVDGVAAGARVREEVWRWELHSPAALISPGHAVAALGELSPGGALMKPYHDESLAQLVAPGLAAELTALYASAAELLRHFWACFPPTTPELQAKLTSLHHALSRFHHAKLQPFENKVMLEFSPLSQQLTAHLNLLLNTAYNKFDVWQSRVKQMPGIR